MRTSEHLRSIISSLPDQGIGIHGTNLARARCIAESGFYPAASLPEMYEQKTWYIVQPPNSSPYFEQTADAMINKSISVAHYAFRAAENERYELPNNLVESKIPAVVVFLPLRAFNRSSLTFKAEWEPYTATETRPIPKENILGVYRIQSQPQLGTAIIRGTARILLKRKIISVARTQSPDQE